MRTIKMLCRFMKIEKVEQLPSDIETLITESQLEGFRFLARLQNDFVSGVNKFNKNGETLVTVRVDGKLVAIGGINRQDDCARLRRFYVSKCSRRLGVGRELLEFLEKHASQYFTKVTLFTDTLQANQFYEACGYLPVNRHHVSHEKAFT
ncbi:acetyltransferase [Marinomonas spartinae]|uniref:Acetyltransferase n=2 Tax=Marinomonas spartinae TaxID=1792290 RepID=A0A1A8TW10_9GAMM|nr:acetyltransferase [Marinomonas spartinae]